MMVRHEYLPNTSSQNDDSELSEKIGSGGGNNLLSLDYGY